MYDEDTIAPDEDDAFISDTPRGYGVASEGRFIGETDSMDEAVKMLVAHSAGFFPDVWFVNDHGNTELLSVNWDDGTYEYAGIGFV